MANSNGNGASATPNRPDTRNMDSRKQPRRNNQLESIQLFNVIIQEIIHLEAITQ